MRTRCSTSLGRVAGAILVICLGTRFGTVAVGQTANPRGPVRIVATANWFGDTSGPLVYAADGLTQVVQVFSGTTHREVGLISGTVPAGLTVDGEGNVYVADMGFISGGQRVLEFAPHGKKPVRILDDSGFQPDGLAVGPDGTVYVANDCPFVPSYGGCVQGPGNVVAYAPGATQPTATLAVPGMRAPERVALDAAGDIAVAGLTGFICSECPPGKQIMGEFDSTHTKFTRIDITHPLTPMHFDSQGRLALLRPSTNILDLYSLPSPKPVGRAQLGTPQPDAVRDFAFSSDGTDVWTSKILYSPDLGHEEAMEFAYPGGQQSAAFLVVGTFVGAIAVSPGLQP